MFSSLTLHFLSFQVIHTVYKMEEESDTETEMLYQSGGEESEDFDDRRINEVLDAYHDTEKNYAHSGKKALYEKRNILQYSMYYLQ